MGQRSTKDEQTQPAVSTASTSESVAGAVGGEASHEVLLLHETVISSSLFTVCHSFVFRSQ